MSVKASSIKDDARVIASINRLKKLGLTVYFDNSDPDLLVILIDSDSIIRTIKNLIAKSISYPKFLIFEDKDNNIVGLYIWRGEEPLVVKEAREKMMRSQ